MRIPVYQQPPVSEQDLLARTQQLAGLTLGELADCLHEPVPRNQQFAKGWVGQLLERYLGATAASLPEPDFQHLGVELKSLPLGSGGQPRESTYVCTVPMTDNHALQWETSWVRLKLQRVLWVPLQADKHIPLAARRLGTALLWSPSPEQEAVLRQDWEELMDMVCLGEWENISAHHGTYLQIRPKAAHAGVRTEAYDADGRPAAVLPRGFYLRSSFTRQILVQHYAIGA